MSSSRVRFSWAASSFSSAARRRALYFVMPAASSISCRRSAGRVLSIIPILPCSMMAYALAPRPVSIRNSCTSRSRQISPSSRYSLSPDRYSRRVTSTVLATRAPSSSRSHPAPGDRQSRGSDMTSLSRSRTSAAPVGLRASLPLKMTSSMRSPRRLLALCSPSTQVMASATLLLPHPFGPTIAVTPRSNERCMRSEKDLKPEISSCCRCISWGQTLFPASNKKSRAQALEYTRTGERLGRSNPKRNRVSCAKATARDSQHPRAGAPRGTPTAASVTSPKCWGKRQTTGAKGSALTDFRPRRDRGTPSRSDSASPNRPRAYCACGSLSSRCRRAVAASKSWMSIS